MDTKITGYILVTIGLTIILASALNVFSIFKGSKDPITIFNFDPISLSIPGENQDGVPSQPVEMVIAQPDLLNKPSNLLAHIFFAGFFASIGLKVATIGTNLLRPVVIKGVSKTKPNPPGPLANQG